jgi:hypothetical protein
MAVVPKEPHPNHLVPKLPELADRFESHLTTTTFESSFLDHYAHGSLKNRRGSRIRLNSLYERYTYRNQ